MIYNGDSDEQDLVHVAYDLTNTNVVTYPLKEMARAANKTDRRVWSWIFMAYGGWQYDDSNNTTDFPIATAQLNNGQADYDLPPGSLTVRGVEIQPYGSAVYQRLYPITEEELISKGISEASLFTSSGVPMYYRVIGNSIKLYAAPNYTQANALRVTFDRGSTAFASTSTTQTPGFASEFHEVIAVGMAFEYARRNSLPSYEDIKEDLAEFERNIKAYYASRYQEKFPARMTVVDATLEFM